MEMFFETPNWCVVAFQEACIFPFKRKRGRFIIQKTILLVYSSFMISVPFMYVYMGRTEGEDSGSDLQDFLEDQPSKMAAVAYMAVVMAVVAFCLCWLRDVFFKRAYLEDFLAALDSTSQQLGRVPFRLTVWMKGIILGVIISVAVAIVTVSMGLSQATFPWVGFLLIASSTLISYLSFISVLDLYFEVMLSLLSNPHIIMRGKYPHNLINIYDKLCTAVENLNGYYGLQLFIIIAYCTVGTTSNAFFMTKMYKDPQFTKEIIMTAVYCSTLGIFVLALAQECSSLCQKAGKFSKLLSTYALQDRSEQLTTNPFVTMHFLGRKKLEFSVCGCFNLDNRLLCSIVAACVTYLVILVQIDDSKTPSGSISGQN